MTLWHLYLKMDSTTQRGKGVEMAETFYLLTVAGGSPAVVMEGSSLAEVERACPGFSGPVEGDENENEIVPTGWFLQPIEDEDYLIARGSDMLDEGTFEAALLMWKAEGLEMDCEARQGELTELTKEVAFLKEFLGDE